MKKIALFVTALAVSLSIGGTALADTNTATFADKAGITPDNTILYSIDKSLDNLKVNMASGDDKKAEALADIAEERLGESELMIDKEKTDLSSQALNEYSDKVTEAQGKIDDAIDKTPSNTSDDTEKLEKLQRLETSIINRQMKSLDVLKSIESKVSGNAKETLAQVIEMQTRKKEAMIEVSKERQTLLEAKKAVKEAENKLNQAKKAGDEQIIKTAEDTLNQAQIALAAQNEKLTKAVAARKEAMKGGVGQLKKQAKKEQTKDKVNCTNNTTSQDSNTTTETNTANTNADTNTSSTASTASTANTTDTTSATTQGTVDNNTTVINDNNVTTNTEADTKVKENKGHEIKNNKENKGHDKENKNNSKH